VQGKRAGGHSLATHLPCPKEKAMLKRLPGARPYRILGSVFLVDWVLVAAVLTLGAVTGLIAMHNAVCGDPVAESRMVTHR
jgi:hypothetical protein